MTGSRAGASAFSRLDVVANASVVIAALVLAGVLLRREFGSPAGEASNGVPTTRQIKSWEAFHHDSVATTRGRTGGSAVLEFMDLECPYCARHGAVVDSLFPSGDIPFRYSVVHLPLGIHRFARPAAQAAECARDLGGFFPFISAVMRGQDSLGLKSWSSFARDAGIADSGAVASCLRDRADYPRIARGVALAGRLGISSTPTLMIDGRLYSSAPSQVEFARLLDSLARAQP